MKRFLVASLAVLLSPPLFLFAEDSPIAAKTTRAVVRPNECVFEFPIGDAERTWEWGVSPASQCEYSWMVNVTNADATYQVGFSYFNPTAIPSSGKIDELLLAGQCDVWKLAAKGGGASVVNGVRVISRSKGGVLQVVTRDPKWIEKAFGDKPEYVTFETQGSQLQKYAKRVKVIYEQDTTTKQDTRTN